MKRGIGILLALLIGFTAVGIGPERVCASNTGTLVVVLDAGHGGKASGACRTWNGRKYIEKQLNLTIAKYAKEELEQYLGVKVYMTRTEDRDMELEERVLFARQKGADLFVSLHNNWNDRSSIRGACVYYPNYNYNQPIGEQGRLVALSIQKQLSAAGLNDRGVLYRNSEDRTRYPDQKLADYYSVIRNSKLNGFPGLIVEHAYLSNSLDCSQFLSSDDKLKKLGVADAAGIAAAYGLVKGGAPVLTGAKTRADGSVELAWIPGVGMDGYSIYRRQLGKKKYKRIAEIRDGEETGYEDVSAEGGVFYEYYITAWVAKKKTVYQTGASNRLAVLALGAPEFAELGRGTEGELLLTFAPVEGAQGYLVARRASEEESWLVVAELDADTNIWADPDTVNGEGEAEDSEEEAEESEEAAEDSEEEAGDEEGYAYEYQVCAFVKSQTIPVTGAYTIATSDTIELEVENEE